MCLIKEVEVKVLQRILFEGMCWSLAPVSGQNIGANFLKKYKRFTPIGAIIYQRRILFGGMCWSLAPARSNVGVNFLEKFALKAHKDRFGQLHSR